MLVLSRKMDEQIVIGEEIRITVLRVKGDRVKLGIQAGDEVKIMRGELLELPCEPVTDPNAAIADPTAGLADEEATEDNAAHPAGPCEETLSPPWPGVRPAWLAICCCS